MRRSRNFKYLPFAVAMVALSAVSCSSFYPVHSPGFKTGPKEAGGQRNSWWYARFVMNWPEGSEPSWYMDLFLAHKVIAPTLAVYKKDIVLWRFHRRAARDQAGHQFSFIFYSSHETALDVYDSIRSNRHLRAMKRAGVIIRDTYDDINKVYKPNIEDTSDANWSAAIQKSWPYYIMGVSQMWLNLVEYFVGRASNGEEPDSSGAVMDFYKKVNESIGESWQKEGDHALLHHLNAIFGYQPIIIYEKSLVTF